MATMQWHFIRAHSRIFAVIRVKVKRCGTNGRKDPRMSANE